VTLCVSIYYSEFPVSQETHRFCHTGVGYRRYFPYFSKDYQFITSSRCHHPRSSWLRSPICIQQYVFFSAHFLRHPIRHRGSEKAWPHFISGYPLKKRSWLSAIDFKRSGTQK
jgi:hypothetical protein